jgi:AcrR family transcriptional regulator
MARIAKGRDRVLTREEIAAETLRQFDTGAEPPSIRALAAALGVAPSAIYHHFESQAAIVQAATELVWEEATRDFLAAFPDPYREDPAEVLVAAGITTRRAFGRHYRIAPFIAASAETTGFMTEVLGVLAVVFERLGLQGEDASVSFHTYASFTIGAVLFAATRRVANEKLGIAGKRRPQAGARRALDDAIDVPATDPARDEELFAAGLRRLIQSFTPAHDG